MDLFENVMWCDPMWRRFDVTVIVLNDDFNSTEFKRIILKFNECFFFFFWRAHSSIKWSSRMNDEQKKEKLKPLLFRQRTNIIRNKAQTPKNEREIFCFCFQIKLFSRKQKVNASGYERFSRGEIWINPVEYQPAVPLCSKEVSIKISELKPNNRK